MIDEQTKIVRVACTRCGQEHSINEIAREEPLVSPYESVTEGFLLCPDCGLRTHTYYLPDFLRQEQSRLSRALDAYKANKTVAAWNKYQQHLKVYQNNYSAAQDKYRALTETESGRN